MSGGSEAEELDVELLQAARFGDLDAITTVCNHYRGRLLILARNAGAAEPEAVVQDALTAALLGVEPDAAPALPDFERGLFERVVSDSDVLTPRPPVEPSKVDVVPTPSMGDPWPTTGRITEPTEVEFDETTVTIDQSMLDTLPALAVTPAPTILGSASVAPSAVASVASVASEPAIDFGAEPEPLAGGVLLNREAGPVDWSALAVERTDLGPTRARLSKRLLAGGGALLCGVGVIAAVVVFMGGAGSGDDTAGPVQQAELVPEGGSTIAPPAGSSSGPASADGDAGQNRSSGTVTDDGSGSEATLQVETSSTSASTSISSTTETTVTTVTTTASTAPTTTPTSDTPPTTAASTTVVETTATTRPGTTITITNRFRPGNFRNQSIDNQSFRRGDFRDHDFTGAVLNNVVFSRADLSGVSFVGATMTNVRFTDSDLTGADFRGANMDNTEFENTNVSRVDFRGSELTNGGFDSTFFVDDPIGWPEGDFDDD